MFILTKGEWWIACLEFFHIALFAIRLNEYIIYNRLSFDIMFVFYATVSLINRVTLKIHNKNKN